MTVAIAATVILAGALTLFGWIFLVCALHRERSRWLKRMKENRSKFNFNLFLVIAFVVAAIIYAGTKPSTIIFDDYIRNDGSYVTNDYIHVSFTLTSAAIPSSTEVGVWYRERTLTNETDWVEYSPRWTVADYPRDLPLANATNYNWCVWLDFTPAPSVHTNGVWELKGFMVPGGATFNNTKLQLKGNPQ